MTENELKELIGKQAILIGHYRAQLALVLEALDEFNSCVKARNIKKWNDRDLDKICIENEGLIEKTREKYF